MKRFTPLMLGLSMVFAGLQPSMAADDVVKIGFDIPLTGEFQVVGNNAKNTGEMIKKQIMDSGGLKVGNKTYKLEFIYGDNTSSGPGASSQILSLVSKDRVLGVIGPLSSRQAVPAGEVSNAFSTPMISPWSTSPATTKNRPFVFRSGYLIGAQAPVLTKFAAKEFGAKKAAILYDIVNTYPRYMAKDFKAVFEAVNGAGSVVAYEEFRTGDQDFSKQLKRIVDSDADILFTPQHYNEVPLIVKQAKVMGWTKPIIGSNSWAGGDLVGECGDDCKGLFFVGNYAAGGATGINKKFVEAYKAQYGVLPDEVAGLTWDATLVLLEAIKNTGGLSGDVVTDRDAIRKQLVAIKDFEGVSGKMSFDESGDPSKCAVMIKISDQGIFTHHEAVCP